MSTDRPSSRSATIGYHVLERLKGLIQRLAAAYLRRPPELLALRANRGETL
jgi:hypothetical protein